MALIRRLTTPRLFDNVDLIIGLTAWPGTWERINRSEHRSPTSTVTALSDIRGNSMGIHMHLGMFLC